jgi:hypothetical protein
MFHYRHKNSEIFNDLQVFITKGLLAAFTGFLMISATTAQAAINPGTKAEKNSIQVYKSDLSEFTKNKQAILDWQTQTYELAFDLPADSRYESLDLFLTAIPDGNVSTTAPLTISYNGEAPIPLYGQGSRFDAHIRLDPARIRTSRNSLKISYATPHQMDCLTPANGKWLLDFSRSKLTTKARSKARSIYISEIEQILNHPMTAPKRAAIKAVGSNQSGMEALIAQGMANRMHNLPSFQFDTQVADFTIIAGTRDSIRSRVKDKKSLETGTANIFVDKTSRPTLVLTADTESDVMALVRDFAIHHFPNARRNNASANEFKYAARLKAHTIVKSGKTRLSEIGDTTLVPSWKPNPARLTFNVANPADSKGVLTLDISSGANIDPTSKLKVRLNGHSIGYTELNKNTKLVEFDIKPGLFKSSVNTIEIEPVLKAPVSQDICTAGKQNPPTILISRNSTLKIIDGNTAPNDLSAFAATGRPFFGTDEQTIVVLSARTDQDRAATLKLLGFAAQQFGSQLANAKYLTQAPRGSDFEKNLLFIGPDAINDPELIEAAPSALRLALKGKPTIGPNTQKLATIERYASSVDICDTNGGCLKYAQNARIGAGGIAAVFTSPYNNKRTVGVITASSPGRFANAMSNIASPSYWNGLQGGVARWNNETILMAQTATVAPMIITPKFSSQQISQWIGAKWQATNELTGLDFEPVQAWMQERTQNISTRHKIMAWQAVLILSILMMLWVMLPQSMKAANDQ